jgi:RimJ/RimL family protein N-acetyltransferase
MNSTNIPEKEIFLKLVSKTDHKFLYELFQEREFKTNIIQRKPLTYQKHVEFVTSKPYSKWYIVLKNSKKIGTVYIAKNNDVGIFLKKGIQKKGIGSIALKMLIEKNPRSKYHAKINPKNKKSVKFFQKNSFKLIQYKLEFKVKK